MTTTTLPSVATTTTTANPTTTTATPTATKTTTEMTTTTLPSGCPKGTSLVGCECFMVVDEILKKWDDAQEYCEGLGMYLAEPLDPLGLVDYLKKND
ncbi:unnamed protein product, partial [Meganyctiphanes norvegica]